MTELDNHAGQRACGTPGCGRLVFGGALIGLAIGWFLTAACMSGLDNQLSPLFQKAEVFSVIAKVEKVQTGMAEIMESVKGMRAQIGQSTMSASLGALVLVWVGCMFVSSGRRPAERPSDAATSEGG